MDKLFRIELDCPNYCYEIKQLCKNKNSKNGYIQLQVKIQDKYNYLIWKSLKKILIK